MRVRTPLRRRAPARCRLAPTKPDRPGPWPCVILAVRHTRRGKRNGHEDTMGQVSEVKVPDIGNYTNVPVIEVLVKAGDTVAKDQGLVTLESDKATMEVPSSMAGVVKEVRVKLGDAVSEGTVVAVIETAAAAAATR